MGQPLDLRNWRKRKETRDSVLLAATERMKRGKVELVLETAVEEELNGAGAEGKQS